MNLIYISGKIKGTTDYMERFALKERMYQLHGAKVVNPAKVNAQMPEMSWKEHMVMSLTMLSLCDTIFMLRGWETSPGAKIEHEYAAKHGYKILYEGGSHIMTKRCCRNCANYLHGGSRRTSGYVCACGKRTPAAHLETTCKDFVVKRFLSDEGKGV